MVAPDSQSLGTITGDGQVVVKDSRDGSTPVDLPLEKAWHKTCHNKRLLRSNQPVFWSFFFFKWRYSCFFWERNEGPKWCCFEGKIFPIRQLVHHRISGAQWGRGLEPEIGLLLRSQPILWRQFWGLWPLPHYHMDLFGVFLGAQILTVYHHFLVCSTYLEYFLWVKFK